MDTFLLFGLIGFSCLILSFIGYSATTNKIIKDQERDIAKLETENKRLKSALRGKRYVKDMVYYDYPVTNPKAHIIKDPFKEF